ncbi:unnamed protein product [Mytilus coruscus]|uniref:DNA-directed DNA polymerase n=1 Tax=Mytilus coruscus TaxID=42192 RepID=A0A6J8C555_MYTCO|nr:unnamed protein product [Mytilus coruscus]
MKYKQEASGCKCDPKYCKPDCENDKECKTKIQYIIDNAAYNLDIDKVKHNSGLRFIAKICLNNLWGHFAHARLKLYELLDILQERVLYMDTDSCIYNDDGSEACKKVENMMGSKLGDLTDEIVSKHNANHKTIYICWSKRLFNETRYRKLVSCCKGFRLNAEVEEKITLDKKIKIVTDENEKYETVKYDNIKIGKDHQLKTVKQVKAYDYMFDKKNGML